MTRDSLSGRRTHHEPPCVTQGAWRDLTSLPSLLNKSCSTLRGVGTARLLASFATKHSHCRRWCQAVNIVYDKILFCGLRASPGPAQLWDACCSAEDLWRCTGVPHRIQLSERAVFSRLLGLLRVVCPTQDVSSGLLQLAWVVVAPSLALLDNLLGQAQWQTSSMNQQFRNGCASPVHYTMHLYCCV